MKLFKHLVLETNSFCTRKCIFCPKYKDERKEIVELPMETIYKIVDELKELDFNHIPEARMELTLYNEPTSDKRLPEIIKYIRESLPRIHIFFNSNGDIYKKSEQYIKLFESGLSGLELNIYDKSRKNFLTNMYYDIIKLYGKEKFNNSYTPANNSNWISESVKKGNVGLFLIDKTNFGELKSIHKIRNRAGNIPWLVPDVKIPIKMVCGFPFRHFIVRSNGDINLCCDDYYGKGVYENINNSSIKEIWESEKITEMRRLLLKRDRNFEPCNLCDNKATYYTHYIYRDWKELVEPEKSRSLFE